MKKLLLAIALFTFPAMTLTGCGGSGGGPVEPVTEADGGMTAEQRAQYEEAMKSGAGSSSRPGN